MNSLSANTIGGRSPFGETGFVPRGQDLHEVGDYTYSNFVKDLLYYFMVETMEDTNEYVIVPNEVAFNEDIKPCIDYGTSHNYIWVVPIGGTPLTYIEVVSPKVAEDLLYVYATDYVISQRQDKVALDEDVEVDKVANELKEHYTNGVIEFISTLQSLVTTKDVFKPFGVAGLGEEKSALLDGQHLIKFRVSFSKFLITLDRLGLRPIGIWSGHGNIRLMNPKGRDEEPIPDVRVNQELDCIFVKGIHLKRTTIRDYSKSEGTEEL